MEIKVNIYFYSLQRLANNGRNHQGKAIVLVTLNQSCMSKTTIHKHVLFIYISSIYSFIEQIIVEGLSCTQHRNSSWGLHFSGRKTDSKLINKTIYSFSNADMSHCRGKTPQKTKDIISVLHINS